MSNNMAMGTALHALAAQSTGDSACVRTSGALTASAAFGTDAAGRWAALGAAWTQITGHEVGASLGRHFLDFVHPDDRVRHAAHRQPLVACPGDCDLAPGSDCCRYETRYLASDGSVRWLEVFARAVRDEHGCVTGTQGTLTDITPRRLVEERLRLVTAAFDGTSDGIVITDLHARIVEVNDAFVTITGYTREQALGSTPALLSSGRHSPDFYRQLWASLLKDGHWSGEIWNRRADGALVAELLRISAVHSPGGEITHYVGIFSDVTASKRQQERLEQAAHYDALTGLPNRTLALDRLGQALAAAGRQHRQVAVCCVDLDGFTAVNERLGHVQGDALLVAAAERIRGALRACDTVARAGGDEFVLLLGELDAPALELVLQRVLQALAQPFALGSDSLGVTASIGVATFPGDGSAPEQLLRAADQAMYRAKQRGRNQVCMAAQLPAEPVQVPLLQELGQALAQEQLCLHYQPQVCAHSRQIMGVEALVRWQHPRHGLLAPGAFLHALVGTRLEVELDLWVVRAAVRQLCQWRAAGHALRLSINVSPGTLLRPDMADMVAAAARSAGLGADARLDGIELEVLETAALADMPAAIRTIEACARHGLSFALDDFGTGYSSLAYLQRLPVSKLKIDRSFVADMLTSQRALHIVRAVTGLAQAFGIGTVAEGVETEAHAQALAELGCQELQGFGIARPMSAQALSAWLQLQASCRRSNCPGPAGPAGPAAVPAIQTPLANPAIPS